MSPAFSTESPPTGLWLHIDLAQQQLTLCRGHDRHDQFPVSTGLNGVGEQSGSGCTPRGWHDIVARIGEGQPRGAVFRGRRPTGEIYSPALAVAYPDRDWILTRILWLRGLEWGVNRGGNVDSQRRYIYLHGTPPTEPMGVPRSHGCIRLRDDDLLRVFEQVSVRTPVWLG